MTEIQLHFCCELLVAWAVASVSVSKHSDKQHKTQDCWQTSTIGRKHHRLPAGLMRKSDLNYPETHVMTIIQSIATTILQTRNIQFCRTGWLRHKMSYTCVFSKLEKGNGRLSARGMILLAYTWSEMHYVYCKNSTQEYKSTLTQEFVDFYIALLPV